MDQKYLKSVLHYDEDTGLFHWKIDRTNNVKKGDIAGTKLRRRLTDGRYSRKSVRLCLDNKFYQAHNLAYLYLHGELPKGIVDHINGDPWDNRWDNLRDVSTNINNKNKAIDLRNKTGFTNITITKNNRYLVRLNHNKKTIYCKTFDTLEDAKTMLDIKRKQFEYHDNHGREKVLI